MYRLLSLTRHIIMVPVFGSWVAALFSMGFGAYEIINTIRIFLSRSIVGENVIKASIINLVEAVDLFLLGTAFYLISLGMYELFVDEKVPVPAWLVIEDLDDLKSKLIGVVVVVLGVQFLAQVLNWKGEASLLMYGAAIAFVVIALGYFVEKSFHKPKPSK